MGTAGGEDPSVHGFMPDMHVSEEAFAGIAVTSSDMLAYDSFTSTRPPVVVDPESRSAQSITETGTTTPQRPKVRRKFGPERRKEVLEVRKMGACMRCRMLRRCAPLVILARLALQSKTHAFGRT